jgi:alkylhydroperoxidase family enzyme
MALILHIRARLADEEERTLRPFIGDMAEQQEVMFEDADRQMRDRVITAFAGSSFFWPRHEQHGHDSRQ